MTTILEYLFGAASFMPHGYCLLWRPDLVAMHAIADAMTAAAYFSIPAAIFLFLKRRASFEHKQMAWLFAIFITFCGLTHLTGLATLWVPAYGFEGLVKLATGAVSVATAFAVWPLLPKVIALPSPGELQLINDQLHEEIGRRQAAERELQAANDRLNLRKIELEDQVRSEQREVEQRAQDLRDTFETITDGIALFDADGGLRLWNQAYQDLYPKSADLYQVGSNYIDAIKEGARRGEYALKGKSIEEWAAPYIEHFQRKSTQYDIETADGRTIEVKSRRTAKGEVVGVRRDVTEQREHAARIQRLRERLQLVLDMTSNGIVALDREGKVALANRSARHMLGDIAEPEPFEWPSEIHFLDIEGLHPLDASSDPIQRALAGQQLRAETNLMTRKASEVKRFVRINSAVVADAGSPIRTVLAIDDVTAEERNRQQAERSSRLDALGQLTGGIAHDFNNLLAMIQAAVNFARRATDDERQIENLGIATDAVQRGAELTKRLLAFASKQPGLAKAQSLDESLANVRAIAERTIAERIRFEVEEPDLWIFCDPGQLENALLNLILNARDAIGRTDQDGKIVVRARSIDRAEALVGDGNPSRLAANIFRSDGMSDEAQRRHRPAEDQSFHYVDLSVSDNGPGMNEEVKRRAIDPFFTTKSINTGTGLGLSMVYGFVQQSEGELAIHSEVGAGTSVHMLLPRAVPEGRRDQPVSLPVVRGHGETVLVAEDEAMLLDVLAKTIRLFGYKVRTAANGVEALEILERDEPIDLLLTDVVMPGGLGGFELAKRGRELRPGLPVIYMSGYAGFNEQEMAAVVAPMIEKPCSDVALSKQIAEELGRRPVGRPVQA